MTGIDKQIFCWYLLKFSLVGGIHGNIEPGPVADQAGVGSDAVGQVAPPEGVEPLISQGALGAVDSATVGTIQFALFDHLVLDTYRIRARWGLPQRAQLGHNLLLKYHRHKLMINFVNT